MSQDTIPNKDSEYKKLSRIVTDARMEGLIDWDIIEDRLRIPRKPSEFEDIKELVDVAIQSYRLDRWKNQENYVEVWVEKDALSGVLEPITNRYHVNLLVNRGYSSISAMHDSALRIKQNQNKNCVILYLGDHDPSGIDMVRDVRDRLHAFHCDMEVKKIALTMEQINQYNPPPNPAKKSDPRSRTYMRNHGNESWELDALTPETLNELLITHIEEFLNKKEYNGILEEEDKRKLKQLTANFKKKQSK